MHQSVPHRVDSTARLPIYRAYESYRTGVPVHHTPLAPIRVLREPARGGHEQSDTHHAGAAAKAGATEVAPALRMRQPDGSSRAGHLVQHRNIETNEPPPARSWSTSAANRAGHGLESSRSLGQLVAASPPITPTPMQPLPFRPRTTTETLRIPLTPPPKSTNLELSRTNAGPFDFFQHRDVKLSLGRIQPRATRPDCANLNRMHSPLAYVAWCGRSIY